MILPAFRRSVHDNNIYALYGMIVAQVRLGVFYTAYRIPDTVQGRFELLVLHLVLVLRRLGREPETAKAAVSVRREIAPDSSCSTPSAGIWTQIFARWASGIWAFRGGCGASVRSSTAVRLLTMPR